MSVPRILWVFPGFGVGGAQMRFCSLVNHWGARATHEVVSLNGDLACAERLSPGVEVRFPASGHRRGGMLGAVRHARGFLAAARPDVVVTSNWGAIEWAMGARLAGLRPGLRHVHSEDGFGPEERAGQIGRRVWTRRLVLRGSEVILPSRTLERLARDVWRVPGRRLHYIPNGIDLTRFGGAAAMPVAGEGPVAGAGPVVGTIAALRPEKNLGRLLRAVAQLRTRLPVRAVIVGDGPERAGLAELAATLGIGDCVTFAGHSAEAERWMASFDVFALSSDTEQMPLSLLEAMASGLPAVCTDVGDVRGMLAAENAPFVTGVDDAAFAAGLERLMGADWARLGAANRARAEAAFGETAMFGAWGEVLGVPQG